MAVQTLNQIVRSLGSVYNPQVKLIQQRQAAIPGQIAEEERGLGAKQEQAFGDILNGARRRGLGFAGIPLQEQAKYNATEYMPALARLRQSGREQATSLEEAILGIRERQRTFGQQIREGMLQRNLALKQLSLDKKQFLEQRRQFNANLAFQRAENAANRAASGGGGGFAPTLSMLGGGGGGGGRPVMKLTKNGYIFKDPSGRPISAAQYSYGTGIGFRKLLSKMAKNGDAGAKRALSFVGDDYRYGGKLSGSDQSTYDALTSGMF